MFLNFSDFWETEKCYYFVFDKSCENRFQAVRSEFVSTSCSSSPEELLGNTLKELFG